ncbi:MAG: hypothetical protein PHG05_04715 [Candidatus Nanoarchaeia archaeon]|nr:hypothetical protein [Candidatus Nanoarchaeia archaeon]
MKLLLLILFIQPVLALAVYPPSFFDSYDGEFIVYNNNNVKTKFDFSSDLDVEFDPEDVEIEPGKYEKIDFFVNEEPTENKHMIYVNEENNLDGLVLENSLGVALLFDENNLETPVEETMIKEETIESGSVSYTKFIFLGLLVIVACLLVIVRCLKKKIF